MFAYLLDFNAFSVISCTSSSNNFDSVNSRTCPKKTLTKFSLKEFDKENFDSVNAA